MATYTDKFSSGWATLILVVTRDSYSIANNTSKLECVLKIRKDSSCSSYSSSGASISMTIAGKSLYKSSSFDIRSLSVGSTKTLATKYITVTHNSDGTKSVSCKASFSSGVGLGSASISDTYKCGDIPRKSTLSVSNGTLGVEQTLKITEKADSFKHKLKYTCGSKSGYILGGSDTYSTVLSKAWTAPLSLASQSATSKSVSIKFTLYTYTSGGSSVGSNEYTKTFTIPNNSSTQPEISNFEISDATAYYSTYGGYIQGKSKIKATITATGKYSATISEYATTVDGKTYKGSSITSDVLSTSGGQTVSAKVTDSRGISKSSDPIAIEVLEYKNPSIILTVFRVDENGNKKDNGAYLQCNYNLDYSSFNGNNKVTITVYGVPGNSYELAKDSTATSGSKTFEADPDMAYKVYAIVTDSLGGQGNSATTTLLGAERIINIFPDGTGIAFGKKAESSELFECKWDAKFNKDILIKDIPLIDYIYPVGSVFIASENTNPSTMFGGTWTLINKYFTPYHGAITATLKSGATSANIGMTRDSTSIRLRITIVNKVALTDTAVDLCQLPLSTLGVSNIGYTWYGSGVSDNGNSVTQATLVYDTGIFQHTDTFNVSSLATESKIHYEVNLVIPWERRLDSACDRFFWKRTA